MLLKSFESKFQEYVHAWLASPFGWHYKEMLDKTRYNLSLDRRLINLGRSKKVKLRALSASDIAEIQGKEEEVERKFKGIEWTPRQVFEVFEFLSNIAKDQEIKLCAGEFASCFSGYHKYFFW